ncbi:hypothetical protein Aduo_014016 [Ancylostoma duodenale]
MFYLIICYNIIGVTMTVMFAYSLYLVIKVSTVQMTPYKYFLLNIQEFGIEVMDDSFILGGGPTLRIWAAWLIILCVTAVAVISGIIRHISIILSNKQAFSIVMRKAHRSAIAAVLIQVIGNAGRDEILPTKLS